MAISIACSNVPAKVSQPPFARGLRQSTQPASKGQKRQQISFQAVDRQSGNSRKMGFFRDGQRQSRIWVVLSYQMLDPLACEITP